MSLHEVVSDTGPLITLEKLSDGYGFIRQLYDRIIVPPSVLDELYEGQFESAEAYLEHYGIAGLIEVASESLSEELPLERLLDRGERDAIRLALSRRLPLLIEGEAGRNVARRLGLQISGIAGQVLKHFATVTSHLKRHDTGWMRCLQPSESTDSSTRACSSRSLVRSKTDVRQYPPAR